MDLAETRSIVYQLCRAGKRFAVGDGPFDLSAHKNIVFGRGDPRQTRGARYFVDDQWMSSNHASIREEGDAYWLADEQSTNGVLVNGQPIVKARLKDGDIFETGRTFWLFSVESKRIPLLRAPFEFGSYTTWHPGLARQIDRLIRKISEPHHILLSGPEGAGKGFLTRTIHQQSKRPGRLIHLNCAERSEARLRIDLFGDDSRPSKLRLADLGTLYLENIDALSESLQNKLARTLSRRAISESPSQPKIAFDIRVIATTTTRRGVDSSRLEEVLSHHRIALPGLDERRCDLGLLIDDFLAKARGASALTRDACRAVFLHPWALHVRALARVIESAAVLAASPDEDEPTISLSHLPFHVVGPDIMRELMSQLPTSKNEESLPSEQSVESISQGFMAAVEEVRKVAMMNNVPSEERPPSAFYDVNAIERSFAQAIDFDVLDDALRKSHGNVSAAARRVGRPRALFIKWIKEFGLDLNAYRDDR